MPAHDDFADTLSDLLARALLVPVRTRWMFGGHGFYGDDLFIAVLVQGVFYLKTSADTRAAFEDEGLRPWLYLREGRPVSMGFHPVPEAALDDAEALRPWARLAMQAALAAARRKTTAKTKTARPRATTTRKTT